MIIGGENIYKEAMPLADILYLTFIDATFDGDTFFPEVDFKIWKEISRDNHTLTKKTRLIIVLLPIPAALET